MITDSKFGHRSAAARLLLMAVFVLSLGLPSPSLALDEVNLHISAGISGNALLYKFTIEKGFYREEVSMFDRFKRECCPAFRD
jgi:hypothetical protein